MKFALVNEARTLPSPQAKGTCQVCGEEALAKCGNKIVWHWAHVSRKHCDSWWENETEWHRQWKSHYPEEWQEIVLSDKSTGEKHIADVRTASQLAIEFQNSPMPSDELHAREQFYGKLVWIVNGSSFRNNFHILHALPDPACDFVRDIVFLPRRYNHQGKLFYRKSENPGKPSMVEVHGVQNIRKAIEENYVGHHVFDWVRPKSVWYEANASVYFDFGDDLLWNLQTYDNSGLKCVQAVNKVQFIIDTGGNVENTVEKNTQGVRGGAPRN